MVLAGDIHKGDKAVAWAERQFAGIPVLYVYGNHEAYGRMENASFAPNLVVTL